jgi:hypothetical protein
MGSVLTDRAGVGAAGQSVYDSLLKLLNLSTEYGSLAFRANFDAQPAGFSYLDINSDPLVYYVRETAIPGVWSGPNKFSIGSLASQQIVATGSVTPRNLSDRFSDQVNVKDFGVVGNNIADDTAALQAALNSLGTLGGVVKIPGSLKIYIASNLNIPEGCSIEGPAPHLGNINTNLIENYGASLYVASTATIIMNNATQIRNLNIFRKGLTFGITSAQVAAQFLGTAITIANNSTDPVVENCAILGFLNGIISVAGANNVSRVRLNRLNMDCWNCIVLENSYDTGFIREVHCWPFVTVASPVEPNGLHLKRNLGIRLFGVNDWTKISDCFTFGYNRGIYISDALSVTLIGCGNDHPGGSADGSIGILIDGNTAGEIRIIAAQCAAKDVGIWINTTSGNGTVTIDSPNIWECRTIGIYNQQGSAFINMPNIRNAAPAANNGIEAASTSTRTVITGGIIKGQANGIKGANSNVILQHSNVTFTGNTVNILNPYKVVIASADPLVLTGNSQFFEVTGATNFGTLAGAENYAGKIVVMKFTGALTVNDGPSMKLNNSFVTTADDTLTLMSDGTSWYEVARSAN